MRIAITGEKGFIGIHLTQYFKNILKYEVVELGRNYLEQLSKVKELDWIIHGACVHRHNDPDVLIDLNRQITNNTVKCLVENDIKCNIALLSSFEEDSDTAYGQSKREAKIALSQYCLLINKEFVSFKLPNIFGEYAVPNRTSFIATFCYNLHNELPIHFNKNAINLISINEVVSVIANFKKIEITSKKSSVEEVYKLLKYYHEMSINDKFPDLKTKFELDLYETYLSYTNYKL